MGQHSKRHGGEDLHLDELLKEARAGSNDALGQLFVSCQNLLLTVAKHELGRGLRAKIGDLDVVQDTFAEAKRDFDGFGGTSFLQFRAWLLQILRTNRANVRRNISVTEKRRVSREVSLDDVLRHKSLREVAMDDAPT